VERGAARRRDAERRTSLSPRGVADYPLTSFQRKHSPE
jgi:hypothetical protein